MSLKENIILHSYTCIYISGGVLIIQLEVLHTEVRKAYHTLILIVSSSICSFFTLKSTPMIKTIIIALLGLLTIILDRRAVCRATYGRYVDITEGVISEPQEYRGLSGTLSC